MFATEIVCAFRPLIFLCPAESFTIFGEEWATKYGSLIACHILYLITFFSFGANLIKYRSIERHERRNSFSL